jgi:hypothetical protein
MERARRSPTAKSRAAKPSWGNVALGAVAIGGVAALLGAAHTLARRVETGTSLVLGGVDLTNVDLSRPFQVDFSVSPKASPELKRESLQRLRVAILGLSERFPMWIYKHDIDVYAGRFILIVTPVATPAQRVAKMLAGT